MMILPTEGRLSPLSEAQPKHRDRLAAMLPTAERHPLQTQAAYHGWDATRPFGW